MASPPYVSSPSAMSPPYPSPAPLPNKKRSSIDVNGPPVKRRKPSQQSSTIGTPSHPLRHTSFPPEAQSPYARSPSVEAASHVSGSVASGLTASGAPRKKRGRKAKNAKNTEDEQTPSLVGGRAPTNVSGQGGEKDGEEDEDEDKAEMAVEDVVARTQEQKQEEIRLRAMLVEAFDSQQYNRYELWRAAKLADSVVKRVVNATVSQSVPQNVSTAVKAVAKLFAGEIIETARRVQGEWIEAGEKQSDLPTPPPSINTTPESGGGGGSGDDINNTEKTNDEENKDKQTVDVEVRRGPLRPDHLREAWRRYRFTGESRGVGVQQLWHAQQGNGVERFSTRTGKRLFK
ncbi:hTAFII28-like protein conserved region-domain-containing protein [Mariannaea sp. PMI_226]|nr:hTAFII28-like protein conserved region-domain-containing protein [Mariannaea sp. PMI_226]